MVVSLVGQQFTETALYVRPDMPVDRLDWRMLVNLEVWVWASAQAPLERITETAWRIAAARPRSSFCASRPASACTTSTAAAAQRAGGGRSAARARVLVASMNVGGTEIGARLLRALVAHHPKECML